MVQAAPGHETALRRYSEAGRGLCPQQRPLWLLRPSSREIYYYYFLMNSTLLFKRNTIFFFLNPHLHLLPNPRALLLGVLYSKNKT